MNKLLTVLVALPAIMFGVVGLRFMIDPAGAAGFLGMPLLDGIGLSSQIGDGGGLFLGTALMIFFGLLSKDETWFKAPALVMLIVAIYRVLAWLVHDAPLAIDMIAVEVVVAVLLMLAASRLSSRAR